MKNNVLKITCLAVGLTLGLVLLAKVCFIEEYNSCIPDRERICQILENFRPDKESDMLVFTNSSGAVAPGMAAAIPEVEMGTRITMFSHDGCIVTNEKREYKANIECADTCFFELFGLPVVCGEPKAILAQNGHAMVSRSLAEALGGVEKVVGMVVTPGSMPAYNITIDGVYEDLPENCMFDFDMILSIECFGQVSLTNWIGNDRYQSFLKFRTAIDKDAVEAKMRKVQEANIDMSMLEKTGAGLYYSIQTLPEQLKANTAMQNLKRLMFFLALAIIIVTVLNYLVIVVSTLVSRVKDIAVYKCYGASFRQILAMAFRESLHHTVLALVLGAVLLLLVKDTAEALLVARFASLFTLKTCALLATVSLTLLGVITFVPACIFSKIPVAAAFRTQRESKRVWKLSLLFLQIAATAVIVCLLVSTVRQYEMMAHAERGYSYDRLLVVDVAGLDRNVTERMLGELGAMPDVEAATNCFQLPFGASGNNVFEPGNDKQLFNIADMYTVSDHYFDVWGIPVVEGEAFDPQGANDNTVMVNREFVRKMEVTAGWTGSIIGRQVYISEHSDCNHGVFTIIGVFEDFMLGSAGYLSLRPMAVFFDTENSFVHPDNIIIKLHSLNAGNVAAINKWLAGTVEEKKLVAEPFETYIIKQLNDERNIRDSLLVCTLVALVIALAGLLGYTTDEVNRRRKEIAIRKVLGTHDAAILALLCRDIGLVTVPALAIGAAIAYRLASGWLEEYSDRVTLDLWTFLVPLVLIFLAILATVLFRSYRAAKENPAVGLKTE